MGLRLREGVDIAGLAGRFGLGHDELCDKGRFAFYQRQGLVWSEGERIGVSEAGMPLLDALLGEIVPAGLVEA